MDLKNYGYPDGLALLTRWQRGDFEARLELKTIFDAAICGEFDQNFSFLPVDEVHSTASVHMLALAILYDLYGIKSAEYYKTDPYDTYVQT